MTPTRETRGAVVATCTKPTELIAVILGELTGETRRLTAGRLEQACETSTFCNGLGTGPQYFLERP